MQYRQYVGRRSLAASEATSETKKQDADRANKLHKTLLDNATRMRARAAQHDYPEPEEPSESEESEGDAHHLRRKLKNGTLLSNNTQSKSK